MAHRPRSKKPSEPPAPANPEYVGSVHLFTDGFTLGAKVVMRPKEPHVTCPVCKTPLVRTASGAICATCGYTEGAP